jgi:hypothetical protein
MSLLEALGLRAVLAGGSATAGVRPPPIGSKPGGTTQKGDPVVKRPSSYAPAADKGVVANVTDLEQDMRDILESWNDAAIDGVNLFTTDVLSKRIDDLESGSLTSFLASLIGNTMWAAAVFVPGGAAVVFAVSMVGIGVAAAPTPPAESKNLIPEVQKLMQNYIYEIHAQHDASLPEKAKSLLDLHPGIGRIHAIGLFVKASFGEWSHVDAKHTSFPTLAKASIRDEYVKRAKARFDLEVALEDSENARRAQARVAAQEELRRRAREDLMKSYPPEVWRPVGKGPHK